MLPVSFCPIRELRASEAPCCSQGSACCCHRGEGTSEAAMEVPSCAMALLPRTTQQFTQFLILDQYQPSAEVHTRLSRMFLHDCQRPLSRWNYIRQRCLWGTLSGRGRGAEGETDCEVVRQAILAPLVSETNIWSERTMFAAHPAVLAPSSGWDFVEANSSSLSEDRRRMERWTWGRSGRTWSTVRMYSTATAVVFDGCLPVLRRVALLRHRL